MAKATEKEKKEYPKRRGAILKFTFGQSTLELPIEVSFHADGKCVIRQILMESLLFPKAVKKGE